MKSKVMTAQDAYRIERDQLRAENARLQELVWSQDRHAAKAQAEIERLQADNSEVTRLRETLVTLDQQNERLRTALREIADLTDVQASALGPTATDRVHRAAINALGRDNCP